MKYVIILICLLSLNCYSLDIKVDKELADAFKVAYSQEYKAFKRTKERDAKSKGEAFVELTEVDDKTFAESQINKFIEDAKRNKAYYEYLDNFNTYYASLTTNE
jgi:hypothetical protein